MRPFVAIVVAGGALLSATQLLADPRREPAPEWELPPVEGRGCYFYREREFCGRYCYVEINGKRYCQERLRDAHSQAGAEQLYMPEPRPYFYRGHYETFK